MDGPGHHRPRASGRDGWSHEGGAVGQHVESAVLLASYLVVPRTAYWPVKVAEFLRVSTTPRSDASVIVATEPLWASLFGLLLLGESLDQRSFVGGALVVAACVVSSLEPSAVRAVLPFLPVAGSAEDK